MCVFVCVFVRARARARVCVWGGEVGDVSLCLMHAWNVWCVVCLYVCVGWGVGGHEGEDQCTSTHA